MNFKAREIKSRVDFKYTREDGITNPNKEQKQQIVKLVEYFKKYNDKTEIKLEIVFDIKLIFIDQNIEPIYFFSLRIYIYINPRIPGFKISEFPNINPNLPLHVGIYFVEGDWFPRVSSNPPYLWIVNKASSVEINQGSIYYKRDLIRKLVETNWNLFGNSEKLDIYQCNFEELLSYIVNLETFYSRRSVVKLDVFKTVLYVEEDNEGDVIMKEKQELEKEKRKEELFKELSHLKYSINLIWINNFCDVNSRYIYKGTHFKKDFFKPIFGWSDKNKDVFINVWFDSVFTTVTAYKNTLVYIGMHNYTNIRLCDIRTIPLVYRNRVVFDELVPIYFRVDLIRLIIGLYLLGYYKGGVKPKYEVDYYVYADMDLEPMNRIQMFDYETLRGLNEIGLVLCGHGDKYDDSKATKGTSRYFENQFQIISNKQEKFLKAIEDIMVSYHIEKAKHFMNGTIRDVSNNYLYAIADWTNKEAQNTRYYRLSESIFRSYQLLMDYYLELNGNLTIFDLTRASHIYDPSADRSIRKEYWTKKLHQYWIIPTKAMDFKRSKYLYKIAPEGWAEKYVNHLKRLGFYKNPPEGWIKRVIDYMSHFKIYKDIPFDSHDLPMDWVSYFTGYLESISRMNKQRIK